MEGRTGRLVVRIIIATIVALWAVIAMAVAGLGVPMRFAGVRYAAWWFIPLTAATLLVSVTYGLGSRRAWWAMLASSVLNAAALLYLAVLNRGPGAILGTTVWWLIFLGTLYGEPPRSPSAP
jgi:hypothetical protein